MREHKKRIMLAALVLVLSTLFSCLVTNKIVGVSDSTTTVSIDPPALSEEVFNDFTVNITVTNVTKLNSCWFKLLYDPTILTFQGATPGPMFTNETEWQFSFQDLHDRGEIDFQLTSWHTTAWDGTGTLTAIKFKCIHEGSRQFQLDGELFRPYPNHESISCEKKPGIYTVVQRTTQIDIVQNYTMPADINFHSLNPLFVIVADNLVFDLNGHTINSTGEGVGTAIEIKNRARVTVKNGSVTNFQWSIVISSCREVNIFNVTVLNAHEYAANIVDSSHIHICNNKMSGSIRECVSLQNCSMSEVSNNTLSNNKEYAIDLTNSAGNIISNNTISDNYLSGGLFIRNSNQNYIFNNNFINNTGSSHTLKHVDSDGVSTNYWNWTYPRGGNYWGDARTSIVDEASGENQAICKIPGPDGIGDTPYKINDNNKDQYPLMNPYGSVLQLRDTCKLIEKNGSRTLSVAVFTNSCVTGFTFNRTSGLISFNVDGGTFCKVIVSKASARGVLEIEIDGKPVPAFLNCDSGCVYANFTYSSGSHKVAIKGETVLRIDGDVNGDGIVNIIDVVAVTSHFGDHLEDP